MTLFSNKLRARAVKKNIKTRNNKKKIPLILRHATFPKIQLFIYIFSHFWKCLKKSIKSQGFVIFFFFKSMRARKLTRAGDVKQSIKTMWPKTKGIDNP